jgi:galactoside O-acetyltransferase
MYLSGGDIQKIGFKSVGENVWISSKTSIYNAQNIALGSHVRIDDFAILSAGSEGITIGNNVHIAAHASLIGDVILEDYTGISHKCTLLSASDDFTGEYFSNPMCDIDKRKVRSGTIVVSKYCVIGAGTVILPGCIVGENSCVGSMSLVNSNVDKDSIYAGIPAKFIGERKKNRFV